MARSEGLIQLAERVEAATGPDRELDADILQTIGDARWAALYHEAQLPCGCPHDAAVEWARKLAAARYPFTASLDAALTLVPEGRMWRVQSDVHTFAARVLSDDGEIWRSSHRAASAGLALCAAALRARSVSHED